MHVQPQTQRPYLKNFNNTSHNSRQCFNDLSCKSLSVSASLCNNFFKAPSLSFDGETGPPAPLPPPKLPVMARAIVKIVIEKAVSIENMVIPCSRNRVQILSAKDVFLSRTFSRVCLIFAACV